MTVQAWVRPLRSGMWQYFCRTKPAEIAAWGAALDEPSARAVVEGHAAKFHKLHELGEIEVKAPYGKWAKQ